MVSLTVMVSTKSIRAKLAAVRGGFFPERFSEDAVKSSPALLWVGLAQISNQVRQVRWRHVLLQSLGHERKVPRFDFRDVAAQDFLFHAAALRQRQAGRRFRADDPGERA